MKNLFDLNRSRISLKRSLLSYSKIQFLISLFLRNKKIQIFGKKFTSKEYLNCGCGPNIQEDFVNLDWSWIPGINLCWDVSKELPLPDQSMKGIYTEHMLEHLPFQQAVNLLNEFRRLLKKGGTLRIVVPDAGAYLDLYQSAKQNDKTEFPYGGNAPAATPMMHVNRVFRDYGHQYAYDYDTLFFLLNRAGFLNISRASFKNGRDPKLLIDSEGRSIESLYVEASA